MLDFYLGTDGGGDREKYLGGINMKGMGWLQENGLIMKGNTGHLPDDPESFPYFDDVILSPEQVNRVYMRFMSVAEKLRSTPGFQSVDFETMERILSEAVKHNSGISTLCD